MSTVLMTSTRPMLSIFWRTSTWRMRITKRTQRRHWTCWQRGTIPFGRTTGRSGRACSSSPRLLRESRGSRVRSLVIRGEGPLMLSLSRGKSAGPHRSHGTEGLSRKHAGDGSFVLISGRTGSLAGLDLDRSLDSYHPQLLSSPFRRGSLGQIPAFRTVDVMFSIRALLNPTDGGSPDFSRTRITRPAWCMQPGAGFHRFTAIGKSAPSQTPKLGGEPWHNAMPLITGSGNSNHGC